MPEWFSNIWEYVNLLLSAIANLFLCLFTILGLLIRFIMYCFELIFSYIDVAKEILPDFLIPFATFIICIRLIKLILNRSSSPHMGSGLPSSNKKSISNSSSSNMKTQSNLPALPKKTGK